MAHVTAKWELDLKLKPELLLPVAGFSHGFLFIYNFIYINRKPWIFVVYRATATGPRSRGSWHLNLPLNLTLTLTLYWAYSSKKGGWAVARLQVAYRPTPFCVQWPLQWHIPASHRDCRCTDRVLVAVAYTVLDFCMRSCERPAICSTTKPMGVFRRGGGRPQSTNFLLCLSIA